MVPWAQVEDHDVKTDVQFPSATQCSRAVVRYFLSALSSPHTSPAYSKLKKPAQQPKTELQPIDTNVAQPGSTRYPQRERKPPHQHVPEMPKKPAAAHPSNFPKRESTSEPLSTLQGTKRKQPAAQEGLLQIFMLASVARDLLHLACLIIGLFVFVASTTLAAQLRDRRCNASRPRKHLYSICCASRRCLQRFSTLRQFLGLFFGFF